MTKNSNQLKPRRCKYCGKPIKAGEPFLRFGHYGKFHTDCLTKARAYSDAPHGYRRIGKENA